MILVPRSLHQKRVSVTSSSRSNHQKQKKIDTGNAESFIIILITYTFLKIHKMRKEVVVTAALTAAVAITAAAALARKRKRRNDHQWKETQKNLRKFARDCATPVPKLWQVTNAFVSDMRNSLIYSNGTNTSLNMLISYVASLPSGDEEGLYYGVNLRRTNFLMLCARLGGKNNAISDLRREEISIPSNLLDGTGSTKELFDFIAVELGKFIEAHPNSEKRDTPAQYKKLGFIVSCPVDQDVHTSGTAITWKSFAADSTLGRKLVSDFNRALEERGVKLSVYAMVDDTVGTLAGGRYYNRESVAAVTLGMGTDAAYVEADAALQWHGPSPKLGEMVISTQMGDFSTPHLPITIFDTCLDAESSNPGFRRFEKLTSGMYLGEIVRRVLVKMAKETALFGDCVLPSKLLTPYQLRSPDMAAMHQDTSEDREVVREKLKEIFGINKSTPMVREVVAEVCDIVAERGARLAGAGILGIIKKLGRIESKKSIVTVEGGLYEHYRVFRNYLNSSIWEMLGSDLSDNVVIENSHGGSGTGALYLAASQMKDAAKVPNAGF